MKKNMMKLMAGLVVVVVMLVAVAGAAQQVKLVGTVTGENQLDTDDGETIDIAETDTGNELMMEIGKKVEVIGTVEGEKDKKEIKVESFKVLKK
ncbi:MAG: hypothetical protein AB1427_01730 [Thermodesulfobacteriota bacterium]